MGCPMFLRRLFGGSSANAVTVSEAQRQLHQDNALLVDVREDDEWQAGHVAGAQHIPLGNLADHLDSLPHDRPLLLFCRSGGRSSRATTFLQQQGFTNASNVTGGVLAWQEQGLPLKRGK